jgi:hypothetical protein
MGERRTRGVEHRGYATHSKVLRVDGDSEEGLG